MLIYIYIYKTYECIHIYVYVLLHYQVYFYRIKLTLVLILLSFGGIFNLAFQPASSILSNSDFVDKPEFNVWLEFICASVIILKMMLYEFYMN